jgi:hypothetical protein
VEKGVAVLSRALAGVAEIRPFAFLRNERSAGIKTSVSCLTQDDWRDCDPDSCGVDHRRPIELLPNVSHHVVATDVISHFLSRTEDTSAGCTIFTCSTIQMSTKPCASGWARR